MRVLRMNANDGTRGLLTCELCVVVLMRRGSRPSQVLTQVHVALVRRARGPVDRARAVVTSKKK